MSDITAAEVVEAYNRLQACKGNLDSATLDVIEFWERRLADADRKATEAQIMLRGELNGNQQEQEKGRST